MRGRQTTRARWHAHVNHVSAPEPLRHWLTDPMSMTEKLMGCSAHFRVRRLSQARALCNPDEYAQVGLERPLQVRRREVLLECDGVPVLFGHSIVPLTASAYDWPFFATLGERPLGATLFNDPQVTHTPLQYARLHPCHPLVQRAVEATGMEPGQFYARRRLYFRRRGRLLVTELFLPGVVALHPTQSGNKRERYTVR